MLIERVGREGEADTCVIENGAAYRIPVTFDFRKNNTLYRKPKRQVKHRKLEKEVSKDLDNGFNVC